MKETVITIILTVFASGGFWTCLQTWLANKSKRRNNEQKLILGLAFRQIIELCEHYLNRGYIDREEYKELNHYLFEPYQAMGGNGTAQRLIKEVENLPIKKGHDNDEH